MTSCSSELRRPPTDARGWRAGGRQNRLRGAARRPGWVRFPSIPANDSHAGGSIAFAFDADLETLRFSARWLSGSGAYDAAIAWLGSAVPGGG